LVREEGGWAEDEKFNCYYKGKRRGFCCSEIRRKERGIFFPTPFAPGRRKRREIALILILPREGRSGKKKRRKKG